MTDMLVKLYDLRDDWNFLSEHAARGVTLRKPIGPEMYLVIDWVKDHFGTAWASETDVALSHQPATCFIACHDRTLIGFACYDATALGFFGPGGVAEQYRGHGTGRALLLSCLLDMKLKGYGYAIIGDVGPVEFYRKTAGAVEIPDSTPGIYNTMLRRQA
ncbi:MAG: GNAT family N-acetyltransferase [Kofleriaceae bacterium]|nr:GNAT family N-acetyltransferase [Candidatus Methylomirabilis lanthanidiphila]